MGYVKASILVKFYGPTNHRPARYRVSSNTFSYNKKITVNIDYQLSEYQQVYNAALKWIDAVGIVSDITDVVSIDNVTYAVIVG